MKITNKLIASLSPCEDKHNNYLKHYKGKTHTIRQFMGLRNISHYDKMWVGVRLLSEKDRPLYAADVAESVLHIFEAKYPNDSRPRKAIEAARTGIGVEESRDAAYATYAATYTAPYDAAINAAHAAYLAADVAHNAAYAAYAAHNAAYAAHFAINAAYLAINASTYAATYAINTVTYAAYAAANAAKDRAKQEKLNRSLLIKYLKGKTNK